MNLYNYDSETFSRIFTYEGTDLGANYSPLATTFKVWAPTANRVRVNLYHSGIGEVWKSRELELGKKGVWTLTLNGDYHGVYYTYLVTQDGVTTEACDPYAHAVGVNGKRAMVIDLSSTDPPGWDKDRNPNPLTSYTDAVLYELHVRDFSADPASGIREPWRGKFLALTQTGTTSPGGAVTGLDYLKQLGITHLHLLPVYDYATVDEQQGGYNWGYDPLNYNVPEGSYSTDPYDGSVRITEMKQMVKALHDNGISVVMDVVYNHVYHADSFCFNQIVPGYFSRRKADGSLSNGSGCGNDTASEREMVRRYIIQSVLYWKEEYHIDGFRFDLAGLLDVTTINAIVSTVHQKYPDVIFYGEGWTMPTAVQPDTKLATQVNSGMTPGFAYFSDTMRDLLGGRNGSNLGYVSGRTGCEAALGDCFTGCPGWSSDPQQILQYASCHDNYTLMDKLILSTGKQGADIRRMNNLAAVIYMTARGIPFIHAGEEFFREKLRGDTRCENSYNAGDEVNRLRWGTLDDPTYADNVRYYQGLIALRKESEALRRGTADWKKVSDNVVAFTIQHNKETLLVICNPTEKAVNVPLPEGRWNLLANAYRSGTETLSVTAGSITVDRISAVVLRR